MELNRLIDVLEAKASFLPDRHAVSLRMAKHNEAIFIDLADPKYRVVRITPAGWGIISAEDALDEGVRFIRTSRMAPLPQPATGGSLMKLRDHLNVASEKDFILLVSWLVGATQPTGPFSILVLQGEQGSGKSHIARKLIDLLDPSIMPLCSYPRSERDLFIAANRARVLCYDNLSSITPNLADGFCRLATGGGFATRQLYSDDGEKIFNLTRPVIINGISDLTNRHDLADRTTMVHTRPIPNEKRIPESVLQEMWEQDRPGLFGALCDAISAALKNYDEIQLDSFPRMADFSRWVCAAESALPWKTGKFTEAYNRNREDIVEIGLESDPVASAVISFMDKKEGWEGVPSDLLAALNANCSSQSQKMKGWPKQANILSARLRRSATFLREKDIDLDWIKSGTRKIVISRIFSMKESEMRKLEKEGDGFATSATVVKEAKNSQEMETGVV
jgi:hypothetical protein